MLKRFLVTLGILAGLLSPAFAAGTISFSLSQQFDSLGKPLAGCKLYIYQAGTTTPQTAYQDTALTLPVPGGTQLTCDSSGRLPQFFLADGLVKVRLTDKNGVNQAYPDGASGIDNLLVVGPSSGSGAGGTVDTTTILATGDLKVKYGTGSLSGFVRANGRTIGSATSGAAERANADTQVLFEYLWGADANLTVSGGRGVSANADWTANKTITLPDFRSRALAGLGDMGNSDNTLFAGLTFTSGNSTTLGSLLGAAKSTVAQVNLPNVNFNVTIPAGQGSHTHVTDIANGTIQQAGTASGTGNVGSRNGLTNPATLPAMNGTAASGGSGTALSTISPYALVTFYIKL